MELFHLFPFDVTTDMVGLKFSGSLVFYSQAFFFLYFIPPLLFSFSLNWSFRFFFKENVI